jgi:hypothetical protein
MNSIPMAGKMMRCGNLTDKIDLHYSVVSTINSKMFDYNIREQKIYIERNLQIDIK